MILPTAYMLSPQAITVDRQPAAFGGFCDVYGGMLNRSRVCVKRARVYSEHSLQISIKALFLILPLFPAVVYDETNRLFTEKQ